MKALIALILLALGVWYLISVNSPNEPIPGLPPEQQQGSSSKPRPLSADVYHNSSATGTGFHFFIKEANAATQDKVDERTAVRALGKADAPVTIYVFTSLACPHCADYHARILPQVIKKYVDTNRARLIYVDFPLDSDSMSGAMLAHCLKPAQYLPFINQLFAEKETWLRASKAQDVMISYAQQRGLSLQQARACLADKSVQQAISKSQRFYATTYQVNATPTTVIISDKGKKQVVGSDLQGVEDAIDTLL